MDSFSRPRPTHTSVDDAPNVLASIRTEDHVVWDEPDRISLGRIEPKFVLVSWLLAIATTLVIFVGTATMFALVVEAPLGGASGNELGVLMILSTMSTFIGFVSVMTLRLVRVEHDRVVNSLAVAALNIAVAFLFVIGEVVGRLISGDGSTSTLSSSWYNEIGNGFTVLERSSVTAILGCLLAIGMVPARGGRPRGTQTEFTPQDRQL